MRTRTALFALVLFAALAGGADAGPSRSAAFPVTIATKFGATTIPAAPARVVTLGYTEQDPVLALGVAPVAVREWFGAKPFATWPWARPKLGTARPKVLKMAFGALGYEAIAALHPDLIVATHSGITRAEYERLAAIAPTLAQPGTAPDFGVPWQQQTRLIGRALGRESRADTLVRRVQARIAAARKAAPQLRGRTVAWASPAGGGQLWAVGPKTPPLRFLASLGLHEPAELAAVVGTKDSAQISHEQLRLLDADVLIVQVNSAKERATIERDPLYRNLRAAREGRTIFFVGAGDPVYGALSFSTVLSLPYAVTHLVPKLKAAVDGNPAT